MSITKLATNGVNGSKYDTVSADNYYMEPIATTLLSGTAGSVTFSSIPQNYKHLQIRMFAHTNRTVDPDYLKINFNGDTGSNYSWHYIYGQGASVAAGAGANSTYMFSEYYGGAAQNANTYGAGITDILDYTNVYKFKTIRDLGGYDNNGDGSISFQSGLWMNTAAVTSIKITPGGGTLISANSRFSLYGIKG